MEEEEKLSPGNVSNIPRKSDGEFRKGSSIMSDSRATRRVEGIELCRRKFRSEKLRGGGAEGGAGGGARALSAPPLPGPRSAATSAV